MMCRVWQPKQVSSALVTPAGTSRRFVEPQRAQIHSAVVWPGGMSGEGWVIAS